MENRYFKEEKLVSFFDIVKNKHGNYVFTSNRFFEVYQVLMQKYPQIELPNFTLCRDFNRKAFKKYIFINDINYEIPANTKKGDIVYNYLKLKSFKTSFVYRLGLVGMDECYRLASDTTFNPQLPTNIQFDNIDVTTIEILNYLADEINYLILKGNKDAIELLPEPLIKYFVFLKKYNVEIKKFLELYNNNLVDYKEEVRKIRGTFTDYNKEQFLYSIIDRMIKDEHMDLDDEFIEAFTKVQKESYSLLTHKLINEIDCDKYKEKIYKK